MFCIKSDVITLGSIEMYGFVTVWASMDDGPYWVILLMYGSHDMRHTGFRRLTVVSRTPGFWGVTHRLLAPQVPWPPSQQAHMCLKVSLILVRTSHVWHVPIAQDCLSPNYFLVLPGTSSLFNQFFIKLDL